MKIDERILPRHEIIGLRVKILASSSRSMTGLTGTVIDETKNMLVVRTEDGVKKIPKSTSVFLLTLPDGKEVKLEGRRILGRPEERIRRGR
jgi:ribonuclease P protein subunit POP4